MKRFFIILLLLIPVMTLANTRINGNDSRIVYVGRTVSEGTSTSFDWSGITARLKFTGTTVSVTCSSTGVTYYNVWIDKPQSAKADFVFNVKEEQTVVLAEKLKKGEHSVILQKRNEGENGATATISAFETNGDFLPGEPFKERKIEFIGDSYTCGYGAEASGPRDRFRVEEENCNLTYAAIIGRYFNADISLVSHSGIGIVRNYADTNRGKIMITRYPQAFDMIEEPLWDAKNSGFLPDIVIIYLGTNDFSVGRQPLLDIWCKNYAKLISQVRDNYGEDVPILCMASKADESMGAYVSEAVRRSGDKNVGWIAICGKGLNDSSDLGADSHPNYAGHRKVASCVIPYVSTLTGWEMPFITVE